MTKISVLHANWLVLFVAVALPAGAAEPARPAPAVPSGAQPLKAPLKLDRGSLQIKKFPPLHKRDELDRSYDDFRQKYDATLAAQKRYDHKSTQCMSRTYSVEDQRTAGCSSSDSMNRCNQKLFDHCAKDSEAALMNIWTRMGMSAASHREKVLQLSNSPAEIR